MDLSVVIPVVSAQNHIAACLRSVTRCPRESIDMECVVVNGKGTDETAAVVNRYAERDSRIRLVTVGSGEDSDVRNRGIETASGRYLLLLDADDRLCEDAWEQLEAAVEEEYADFVAFSHITPRGNGKFKAQLLPVSDVMSTDERDARRLMYADAAFGTCRGKLFKSRIIRDNNIFFQTDPASGSDFLFVAEYFEHCESYLMTKAMLLYCPQTGNSVLKDYGMEERLERIRSLYELGEDAAKRYHDSELAGCVRVYYFGVLAALFCEYVKEYSYSKGALETIYEKALGSEFIKRLLGEVDGRMIRSVAGRYEYRLFRKGSAAKLRKYFRVKAMLQRDGV